MRFPTVILLGLLLGSCATLRTTGMSEPCQIAYNACLNACPHAAPPGAVEHPGPPAAHGLGIASCTDQCNDQAKKCR